MENKGKYSRLVTLLFFLVLFIWVLLQFLAPLLLPSDSVQDLTGMVALSDNEHLIDDMSYPWNALYSMGDRLCHQQADRSFFLNGNQMPFCSRCTAIFVGMVIGLAIMIKYRLPLSDRFIFYIIICLTPVRIDGVGQLIGLWESTNIIRVVTGLPAGLLTGILLGLLIDEVSEIIYICKKRYLSP